VIRVATYNLYLGADLALLFGATDAADLDRRVRLVREQLRVTTPAERAVAVARLLARHRPDLVGVQELTRWTLTPVEGLPVVLDDFRAELQSALEREGCPYDVHAVAPSFGGGMPVPGAGLLSLEGVNAVLVRRDVPVVGEAGEAGAFATSLRVPTAVPGVEFPIERGWGAVLCRLGDHTFRFVNTHLEAYDEGTRAAQRDELLARFDGGPVILVGDFNATPDRVGMPGDYLDAWTAGTGPGHTCGQAPDLANEQSRLNERIDYVWVRGARVTGCSLIGADPSDRTCGGLWPSDHAGVLATLDLA
jgi:endonuclease/exonuclease/phosphatase family metal-dependent hydrolase